MEEVVLKVKVEGTGDGEAKIKSVKQQLREAKEAALQAKEGTEEYFKALQKAAGLADQIGDLNKAVDALDPGAKAQAFGNLINGIAGGFQTITGLYGLMGQKSEEVEKLLLKVQSASAIAMGVQSLVEAGKQWKNIKALILNAAWAQQLYTTVVGTSTGALKAFRLALASTGIGALALALYEITVNTKESIAVMDKFIDKLGFLKVIVKYTPNLYTLAKGIDYLKERMGLGSDTAGDYEERIKLVGEALDKLVTAELKRRNAAVGGANDIQRQIKLLQAQGKTAIETADLETKLFNTKIKNIDDEIVLRKTYNQDVTDLEQQRKDLENENLIRQANITKLLAEELAKRKKAYEDEFKTITELDVKARQENDKLENEKGMRDAERRAKELEDTKKQNQDLLEATRIAAREADEIGELAKRTQIQQAEDIRNAKLSIARSTVAGLSALGDILIKDGKKATAFQKTLALAGLAIDTAQAIGGLTAASAKNPLNAPTSGLAGAAQFAAGIVQILANIAQAKKLLFGSEVNNLAGGGGGGNLNVPTPTPSQVPSIQPPTNTSSFLLQDEANFKVYVLESDITNSQQGVQQNKKKALLTI